MRRLLGILTVLLLLAAGASACGDDSGDAGDDPTTTSSGDPTPPSTVVAILSETAAGGDVSTTGVPLTDSAAVAAFTAPFEQPLVRQIKDKVAETDVPEGQELMGAVVSIGCDVPPGVTVAYSNDGVTITPDKVASPMQECFAPVTSVALVLVTTSLV